MDTIERLQDWVQSHCDGEWEHHHGVAVESTNNPGWWVKVDLMGTALLEKPFERIARGDDSNDPQPPWMRCYVEDGVFNGAGDPSTLNEILTVFFTWADQ